MKAAKFQIVKPIDSDWKTLGDSLRDIQYKNAKIMNHCMTRYYMHQHSTEEFKVSVGRYPTKEEMPMPYLYPELRRMFPDVLSNNVAMADRCAQLRWKQDKKDCYYRQEKSLPSYRKTASIPIHQQAWSIKHTDNGYELSLGLYSKNHDGQKRFAVQIFTKKTNKSFMEILHRLISGQYKKCQILITSDRRKPKWYVSFVYEPEKSELSLSDSVVVGVDLGITNSFWASCNGNYLNADGMEIVKYRKSIRERRRSIQKQGPFSGRGGHGVKRVLLPTDSIAEKERRFRDTRYHQYSKRIVDFAVKNGAKTIQMKAVDSLRPPKEGTDSFLCALLADWAVCDLMGKVKSKAAEKGIDLIEVNPAFTSLRCFKCGCINEENRPEWHKFKCVSCGHESHADQNASQNLTIIGIDQIIADDIASGKVVPKRREPLEKENII